MNVHYFPTSHNCLQVWAKDGLHAQVSWETSHKLCTCVRSKIAWLKSELWKKVTLTIVPLRFLVEGAIALSVKIVRIWSFPGPYFPSYGPENFRIRTLFMQRLFSMLSLFSLPFSKKSWCCFSYFLAIVYLYIERKIKWHLSS